jgi:hypothetical protein
MAIAVTDPKKRLVISCAQPGDIFDVQQVDNRRILLVRLSRPRVKTQMSRRDVMKAMKQSPLLLKMNWQELRRVTRES